MPPPMDDRQPFMDRRDAGRVLASRLRSYAGRDDVVVLALPRGGVPVAYEVASALGAPLDVFVVRKLGAPGREERAGPEVPARPRVVRWPDRVFVGVRRCRSGRVRAEAGVPHGAPSGN